MIARQPASVRHPRFIMGDQAHGYRIKYSKLSNFDHDSETENGRLADHLHHGGLRFEIGGCRAVCCSYADAHATAFDRRDFVRAISFALFLSHVSPNAG